MTSSLRCYMPDLNAYTQIINNIDVYDIINRLYTEKQLLVLIDPYDTKEYKNVYYLDISFNNNPEKKYVLGMMHSTNICSVEQGKPPLVIYITVLTSLSNEISNTDNTMEFLKDEVIRQYILLTTKKLNK